MGFSKEIREYCHIEGEAVLLQAAILSDMPSATAHLCAVAHGLAYNMTMSKPIWLLKLELGKFSSFSGEGEVNFVGKL